MGPTVAAATPAHAPPAEIGTRGFTHGFWYGPSSCHLAIGCQEDLGLTGWFPNRLLLSCELTRHSAAPRDPPPGALCTRQLPLFQTLTRALVRKVASPFLESLTLCKVEIGDIVCYVIPFPFGSEYFIRLNIFLPMGFSRFGTAFQDFAIRLEIWGCRGATIHTVSRRGSRNIRELCAALHTCYLDGVIHTWAGFQGQKITSQHIAGCYGGIESSRCRVRGHVTSSRVDT